MFYITRIFLHFLRMCRMLVMPVLVFIHATWDSLHITKQSMQRTVRITYRGAFENTVSGVLTTSYHLNRALLWRFDVADNNRTCLGRHVKCLILPDVNQIWIFFSADFHESLRCQISRKSVQWNPRWSMQTDARTDGHDEVLGTSRDYAKAPKNCPVIPEIV